MSSVRDVEPQGDIKELVDRATIVDCPLLGFRFDLQCCKSLMQLRLIGLCLNELLRNSNEFFCL